jgi:hypothetical protein
MGFPRACAARGLVARIGAPCGGLLPDSRLGACCRSSVVEHSIGNGEVDSSILSGSTIFFQMRSTLSTATAPLSPASQRRTGRGPSPISNPGILFSEGSSSRAQPLECPISRRHSRQYTPAPRRFDDHPKIDNQNQRCVNNVAVHSHEFRECAGHYFARDT